MWYASVIAALLVTMITVVSSKALKPEATTPGQVWLRQRRCQRARQYPDPPASACEYLLLRLALNVFDRGSQFLLKRVHRILDAGEIGAITSSDRYYARRFFNLIIAKPVKR